LLQSDEPGANQVFEDQLVLTEDRSKVYVDWGNAFEQRGLKHDFLRAFRKYREALKENPINAQAYYFWGNASRDFARWAEDEGDMRLKLDQLKSSRSKFLQSIEKDPNFYPAYIALINPFNEINNNACAVEYYGKAANLNPFLADKLYYVSANLRTTSPSSAKRGFQVYLSVVPNGVHASEAQSNIQDLKAVNAGSCTP
jgi:tetratricopeptide (TPR) repeat protein